MQTELPTQFRLGQLTESGHRLAIPPSRSSRPLGKCNGIFRIRLSYEAVLERGPKGWSEAGRLRLEVRFSVANVRHGWKEDRLPVTQIALQPRASRFVRNATNLSLMFGNLFDDQGQPRGVTRFGPEGIGRSNFGSRCSSSLSRRNATLIRPG